MCDTIIHIKVIYIYSLKKKLQKNTIKYVKYLDSEIVWLLLSPLESSVDILSYEEEYFPYQEKNVTYLKVTQGHTQ